MSQRVEIWVDHLEALARVARSLEDSRKAMNSASSGDLEFSTTQIEVTLDGEKTGWFLDQWDDATWLVIETEDE